MICGYLAVTGSGASRCGAVALAAGIVSFSAGAALPYPRHAAKISAEIAANCIGLAFPAMSPRRLATTGRVPHSPLILPLDKPFRQGAGIGPSASLARLALVVGLDLFQPLP
jgi:hypothetical protein